MTAIRIGWIAGGIACLGMTGCVSTDMSDLQIYLDEVKARKSSRIEPLPEVKPYKSYAYSMSGKRDPFEPFYDKRPEPTETASASGLTPDFNRNREELEESPLDSLRMVGTMETEGRQWGIIKAPGGTVHRVQVGNYMGQNFGKIISISEEKVDLREIIPDGTGGWQERQASLALSE